ncbi:MAG TPA: lipoprotein LpqH [Mycobacterium sp.]|nr:lipoprotein LpqH [Mycobacterium sp.]HWT48838.1 lipoprotein LpqH [Mycobacterium sp.]
MTNPDTWDRSHAARRLVLAATGLGVVVLATSLSACSSKGGQPASAPSSSPAYSTTTVMVGGNKHTMVTGVDCNSSAAQPSATPAESGDLTTRITVHDDSASVSLALSDEKPPSVDGFAISLTVGSGQYQLPYQAPQSATQVQATKDGKSYTVTGTGQGVSPFGGDAHQVTFGIHVTCP